MPRLFFISFAVTCVACGGSTSGEQGRTEPGFCTAPISIEASGVVDADAVPEPSGLVASREHEGVYWTIGDSGAAPQVFAITAEGTVLGAVTLSEASAEDWEDLALGPGPSEGDYLFVGDIGDNFANQLPENARANVAVIRFPEPDVESLGDDFELTLGTDEFDTLTLTYPDRPHNAETLMVHPTTGEIVVVTKESDLLSEEHLGPSVVCVTSGDFADGSEAVLTPVMNTDFELFPSIQQDAYEADPNTSRSAALPTAGDISADGSTIAVRTYGSLWMWPLEEGQSIGAAMGWDPCEVRVALELQGESFAFTAASDAYFTVDEAENTIHEALP